MTIKKGEEWGRPVPRPSTTRVATNDAEIVELWSVDPNEAILLTGGDLFRSLGEPPARDPAMQLPIDLVHVALDTGTFTAAAHVVARRSWWRGPLVAVMNCDRLGTWNVAPRAHPNDGRADIIEVDSMGWRQRWQARSRLPSGTHVPHPSIRVVTRPSASFEFERPTPVWIDGRRQPATSTMTITVEPDAATVVA